MRLETGVSLQQELGWDTDTLSMARFLANSQSEPFVISSLSNIGDQLKTWKENFPSIQPTYNVGANTMAEVLQYLQSVQVPFNINNKKELNTLVELGLDTNSAVFTNPVKLGSHIRAAQGLGVNILYCDSVEELHKIKKFHGSARILIQITCEGNKNTSNLTEKFGANIAELPNILVEARNLNLHVEGIALHVDITDNEADDNIKKFKEAVKLGETALNIGAEHGFIFSYLHLGQLCSGTSNMSPQFTRVVQTILETSPLSSLHLKADVSHFLVSSSLTLATKIISVRPRQDPCSVQYYINEGVFGAFANNLISEDCQVSAPLFLGGHNNGNDITAQILDSSIVGPTGDELDEVLDHVLLPRMEEGDWLLFPNMGTMNLTEYRAEVKVEANNTFIYLKKREIINGVKPCPGLQRNWENNNINIKIIELDLDEKQKFKFNVGDGLKGEVGLGSTFIYHQ